MQGTYTLSLSYLLWMEKAKLIYILHNYSQLNFLRIQSITQYTL